MSEKPLANSDVSTTASDLIGLRNTLRGITGDGQIDLADGRLSVSSENVIVRAARTERGNPECRRYITVTFTNYDGDTGFVLHEDELSDGKMYDSKSVRLSDNGEHPAYNVVAGVLREAIRVARKEPVERPVVRGVRSKILNLLTPYNPPRVPDKMGSSH